MTNLGYTIGRTTVQRILHEHGIEPAPERESRGSWAVFIKSHLGSIAAADFFTVELLTFVGLVRHYVFFVIDIRSRKIEIAGIIHQPYGEWMLQIARNLVDVEDGFLRKASHLILDRDPLYTHDFRALLRCAGVKPVCLPARSPNLNAYAERFVLSIKTECLSRLILFNEAQLRRTVDEYVEHYHRERNHQGLGNELIDLCRKDFCGEGAVECRERLGGVLEYYCRAA